MSNLLPHNATAQERALSAATERIDRVPVTVRDAWNPQTCPPDVLPWLAWAFSVDQWDPAWPDEAKRQTIASAIEVQRIKGTSGAVRRSLEALGMSVRVLEWHRQQVPGAAYTYKLLIDTAPGAPVASLEALNAAIAAVDRTKSLRSHLDTVEISTGSEAGPYHGAVAGVGSDITVAYGGQLI